MMELTHLNRRIRCVRLAQSAHCLRFKTDKLTSFARINNSPIHFYNVIHAGHTFESKLAQNGD